MKLSNQNIGLEAKGISKTYGNVVALDNLNFKVNKGEIYCLLGQNGAGKTTTINIFLGLLKPSSGQAIINGISVSDSNKISSDIAYIPEVVQLYGRLSGLENLDFFDYYFFVIYEKVSNSLSKMNMILDTYFQKWDDNEHVKSIKAKIKKIEDEAAG